MRIPGFTTDEIRTVRRPGGNVNWQQKLTAVQAAKLTGGGNESGPSDGATAATTAGAGATASAAPGLTK